MSPSELRESLFIKDIDKLIEVFDLFNGSGNAGKWDAIMGAEIGIELSEAFKKIPNLDDYYYPDNFRAFIPGSPFGEKLYEVTKRRGCCGSYDEIVEINGIKIRFGFNYGH